MDNGKGPPPRSCANAATLKKLVLNGVISHHNTVGIVTEAYISGTPHVEMLATINEAPSFPSDRSIDLDGEQHGPIGLVLAERLGVEGRNRYGSAVDER